MNRKCYARHIGAWAIEPTWFNSMVEAVKAGIVVPVPDREEPDVDYRVQGGVALIEISGQMTKGFSKYGGANSVAVRKSIRAAASDPGIAAIMLVIDSPGGTVAGTDELAEDVRKINTEIKPVYSHIEDLGASAAYWIASQSKRISATPTSEIGSIGTFAVIVDSSEQAKMEGLKIHVISTGDMKGAGIAGTPVTDGQLEYFSERIEEANAHFLQAVSAGRSVSKSVVNAWADGRVFGASMAKKMGMIDSVTRLDEAMEYPRKDVAKARAKGSVTKAIINTSIRLAENR